MTLNKELIDVIIRTKNSQEFLKECLESVLAEIPIRRIIIVDAGSTDQTKEIGLTYDNVDIYLMPDLNLGQATQFGFSKAQTEWVAVIDSDIILRKGWFENMKKNMHDADAVEGCRIDHYTFNVQTDTTKSAYGRFGQTLLKKDAVMNIHLDLPFGEDAVTKLNFDKEGKKWKKVPNFLADHYTKIDNTKHKRTGLIFRAEPHIIHIPKLVQIQQGHLARQCHALTKKQAIKILLLPPIYEAYWAFKKNFWFTMAYFRLI
ncbi:MAG: glycosyltransferase family 2 protein [Thermoproteota archaeon]|nr:glycosyltransferase family 2 protein [Thermoproteota archaeon]